jgi:hypothetical protein
VVETFDTPSLIQHDLSAANPANCERQVNLDFFLWDMPCAYTDEYPIPLPRPTANQPPLESEKCRRSQLKTAAAQAREKYQRDQRQGPACVSTRPKELAHPLWQPNQPVKN